LTWHSAKRSAFTSSFISQSTGCVPVVVETPWSQIILNEHIAYPSSAAGYIRIDIPNPTNGLSHLTMLWSRLVNDATMNLTPSMRLGTYLDAVKATTCATAQRATMSSIRLVPRQA
jgi:hypothetical protein